MGQVESRQGRQTYYSHGIVEGDFANGENLAYANKNVADEEQLNLAIVVMLAGVSGSCVHGSTYRRPTAAFFLSALRTKNVAMAIPRPHRMIDPMLPRCRPPLSEIPLSSHPPHGPVWLWNF